jgi:hypothetical protein
MNVSAPWSRLISAPDMPWGDVVLRVDDCAELLRGVLMDLLFFTFEPSLPLVFLAWPAFLREVV